MWGAVQGLRYLHRKRVVHLDVKPDNILIKLGANGFVTKLATNGTPIPNCGPISPDVARLLLSMMAENPVWEGRATPPMAWFDQFVANP